MLLQERERRAMARNDPRTAGSEGSEELDGCVAVFAYLDDTIVGVPAQLADSALRLAVDVFANAGHTVHPGKSACWSLSAERHRVPAACQRIWRDEGLKVGGIPVFNASNEPLLAHRMLEKRIQDIEKEADFLTSIIFDDQKAAAESWSRVQAVVLLLRYSLATKLVYFGQTIDPQILEPYAVRFDEIVLRTFLKVLQVEHISEDQKLQAQLALKEGGCGIRSHDLKELQRLYISSALLVAPAVFAATGERIGGEAPDAQAGGSYDGRLERSIRDIVAYGGSRPDFRDGGPFSAKYI